VYAFLPRTLAGNLRDGYAAEARRLTAKGQPLLSVHNQCAPPLTPSAIAVDKIPFASASDRVATTG
jgi:hypothetical protein